jgi:hypothetical protein
VRPARPRLPWRTTAKMTASAVGGQLTPVFSTLSHAKDKGGKAAGTRSGAHDNTARPSSYSMTPTLL